MLSIILPFILISGIYINNVRSIIDNVVIAYQEAIIKQANDKLENIFTSIKILQRSTLGKIMSAYIPLASDTSLLKDDIIKVKELIEYLYVIDNANPYVNGIYVIFESDYIISSRNSVREQLLLNQDWIRKSRNSSGEEFFTKPHIAEYNVGSPRTEYDSVLSYIQEFEIMEKSGKKVLVQIDIEMSAFKNFISSIEYKEQIPMYLLDSDTNKMLLENKIHKTYKLKTRRNEIQIIEEIKREKLFLYAFIRKDRILESFTSAILGTTIIFTFIVLLSFFIALYFSRTITAPLHELYLCMQKVGQGNFSPEYPTTQYKELAFLIRRFQTMVNEVDSLIDTVVKKENETVEAQLQALQAKINPHFLYNTLDVIRSIALEHENQDISDMTLSLSRLFRYNVGNLKEISTLGDEIEYIKDYLKIQRFRFGDRIQVFFDIEAEQNKVQITRFILQPIIENAFKYGLELRGKGGLLKISSYKGNNSLIIVIFDNGPGITKDILSELQDSFSKTPHINSVKRAHGLENVNLRMKLLYGDEYGLAIESEINQWTKIDIKIPFVLEH